MPIARGAAHTARVSGSGWRPSSSMRSRRTSAPRTIEPPSQVSGSGGTHAPASAPTSGSRVSSSSAPVASEASVRPTRFVGPTPLPVKPKPKWTGLPSSVPIWGMWLGETSIGPPQACVMRRPCEAGEEAHHRLVRGAGGVAVDLHAAVHARPVGQPPAAPAEQDAAVAGGAEVVHQRAPVGHALAARPVKLGDHVRHRLGQDDVRGGDGQPRAQARLGARRGADREHDGAGADAAGGGLYRRADAPHRRVLVDRRAALDQAPAQPERQPGGLDRREVGDHHRPPEARRGAARLRLGPGQGDHPLGRAECGRRLDGAHAHLVVRRRRGDAQVARLVEPGVDALGLAPRANLRDRRARGVEQRPGALVAEALAQGGPRQPHRLAEAAVAPARPVTADPALEQGHAGPSLEQLPGRPHAGVAPSNHRHIGRHGAFERGARNRPSGLFQPPTGGSVTPDLRIVRGDGQDPSSRREAVRGP